MRALPEWPYRETTKDAEGRGTWKSAEDPSDQSVWTSPRPSRASLPRALTCPSPKEFNASHINWARFSFRGYEDVSLIYMGLSNRMKDCVITGSAARWSSDDGIGSTP